MFGVARVQKLIKGKNNFGTEEIQRALEELLPQNKSYLETEVRDIALDALD